MNIGSIMIKEITTIQATTSVKVASDLMFDKGIRHLPVMKGENLIGVISERDLALVAGFSKNDQILKNFKENIGVEEIMTNVPVILSPLDSIQRAMELAIDRKYGAFPVMEDGKLVGIVTVIDLLKVGLKALQENLDRNS